MPKHDNFHFGYFLNLCSLGTLYSYLTNNTVPLLVAIDLAPRILIQCIRIRLIIQFPAIYLKLILKQCIRIKLTIIPVDRLLTYDDLVYYYLTYYIKKLHVVSMRNIRWNSG